MSRRQLGVTGNVEVRARRDGDAPGRPVPVPGQVWSRKFIDRGGRSPRRWQSQPTHPWRHCQRHLRQCLLTATGAREAAGCRRVFRSVFLAPARMLAGSYPPGLRRPLNRAPSPMDGLGWSRGS